MKNTLITLFIASLVAISCCETVQKPPINYDKDVNYLNLDCKQNTLKQAIHIDVNNNFAIKCKINNAVASYMENPVFTLDEGKKKIFKKNQRYYFRGDVVYYKGKIPGSDQIGKKIDHTLVFKIDTIEDRRIHDRFTTALVDKFSINEGDAIDIFIISNDPNIDTQTQIDNSKKYEANSPAIIVIEDDYICRTILLNTQ